ncbi:MAG TPA: diguanylate phosphodiesterase [bacterium]|nr:diguanylate phosphodiesterase [bacterium]
MAKLIQLIYSSAASHLFNRRQLTDLLLKARAKNDKLGITGILLYTEGSFFQVLEGEAETVDAMFATISADDRHTQVTLILRETISSRFFGDWTMAYAQLSSEEVNVILGLNDFFHTGRSYAQLGEGRAKKLLAAFKEGRWRTKLSNIDTPVSNAYTIASVKGAETRPLGTVAAATHGTADKHWYSFAYQPIINATTGKIHSYEALVRTRDNQSAVFVFDQVAEDELPAFSEKISIDAIELAGRLGLTTKLNLNLFPSSMESSSTAISSVIEAAGRNHISPDQIIVEILEREFVRNFDQFNESINQCRSAGICLAIDDFGSGYAGLNLLADFQPEYIKLDIHLIRSIHNLGPRQAIIHGIMRACADLGIIVLAEGVETLDEYRWLKEQGIELFQGWLFAKPTFEKLPTTFEIPRQ